MRMPLRSKLIAHHAQEHADALATIAALYEFIVDELDPDPHPIEAYLTDPRLQRQARLAVRLEGVQREHLSASREQTQ